MDKKKKSAVHHEIIAISDADDPLKQCPLCQSLHVKRNSYYFRDLQAMGTQSIKRIVRYETIYWICKDCETGFRVKDFRVLERTPFMPEVVDYATYRVLQKGDSARRVAEDLKILHNVEVSHTTIISWINKTSASDETPIDFSSFPPLSDFSGVMSVDGTFKAVKQKKNEPLVAENEPYCLHLTYLPDGRLLAFWHVVKKNQKCPFSSML